GGEQQENRDGRNDQGDTETLRHGDKCTSWINMPDRAARGESPASHRGRRCALLHPTTHSPRRGGPGVTARRAQSGVPTVRLVHGGVQYRKYLNEEQRSQTRGPQRGSRVGVEEGCSAGRMQLEFHHGLLGVIMLLFVCVPAIAQETETEKTAARDVLKKM